MRRMTKPLLGIAVATAFGATALAGIAIADGGGRSGDHGTHDSGIIGDPMEILGAVDTDRDGKITQVEIDRALSDRSGVLSAHDVNGDGNLNLDEFAHLWREIMQPMIVRAFQMLDTNGDAFISRSEYEQPFTDIVQELDRNADGSLSALAASDHDHDGDDHDDHDDDDDHDDNE